MISHYCTIIQFSAAVYITLSFDNILFRSLWSLDYARLINDRISRLSLTTSSKIAEELKSNITINAALIEKKSRLRGFSVLIFAIITMWIMGYEQKACNATPECQYLLYSVYSIYAFVCSQFHYLMFLHRTTSKPIYIMFNHSCTHLFVVFIGFDIV